jgi:hypothetical protein
MRLRIHFGFADTKEVSWWETIESFPVLVNYLGRNYEWAYYDKDLTGQVDMILNFSELPLHDPKYGVSCPKWSNMFPDSIGGCECGSRYSSFPQAHMFYCKLWRKW